MVTTQTSMQYNRASGEAERVPVLCKKTGKILTRLDTVSIAQLAGMQGGLWCWCRGCHTEHHVMWGELARVGVDKIVYDVSV